MNGARATGAGRSRPQGQLTLGADLSAIGRPLWTGLVTGQTVAPVALGFGVAPGLGTTASLATAIVAAVFAAALGRSSRQSSGPTSVLMLIVAWFTGIVNAPWQELLAIRRARHDSQGP
jgi:MFS superfamily sulfate permease-like transporter